MVTSILGLPVHPLIVHATVVAVPAAAMCVLLAALWPRFRHWFGWGPLVISGLALVLYPLTTSTGEALEHQLGASPAIEHHASLAEGLLPWLVGLTIASIGLVGWRYSGSRLIGGRTVPSWARVAIGVLSVATGLGSLVWVVLVGHAGAEAVWSRA
ncbi:MAG TPA: DUF2231 domain-containing protein [Microlunatus sp.]